MKNRVFLAFSGTDYSRATAVWRALAVPGLTRWISTRDPLDDDKPEPQDMEELARASALVLIMSHRAVQGERLTQELKLARHRGLPILVVLIGAEAKCKQEWAELIFNAAVIRVGALHAEEIAQVVAHIKKLLETIPAPATRSTAAVPSPKIPGNDQRSAVHAGPATPAPVERPRSPVSGKSKAKTSADPLERALTPVEGEDQDDPAYASRRLSMDHPVQPPKPRMRLWPPTGRTWLIGGGVLAALVAGAGILLATGNAGQSSSLSTLSLGMPHIARRSATATPAANAPPAAGSIPPSVKDLSTNSYLGNASPALNSKSVQIEHVLRPSSVLTPDQLGGLSNTPDVTTPAQAPAETTPGTSVTPATKIEPKPAKSQDNGSAATTQPGPTTRANVHSAFDLSGKRDST